MQTLQKLEKLDTIVLTGLMGSGKSSVGRTIARMLKRKFVDTDYLIEKKEGKRVKDIFAENGEAYFRNLEKNILEEVFKEKNIVVSLGGGTVVDDENRAYVKEHGILITLIAEPEEIVKRVKRKNNRPLLSKSDNPAETLGELWDERKGSYMDSDLQVKTNSREIDDISREIIDLLGLEVVSDYKTSVHINASSSSYDICFGPLGNIDLSNLNIGKKILIISQEPISERYLARLKSTLSKNFEIFVMIIENGETAKNFFNYQLILQKCLSLNLERKDSILALGGGVVGDISGFAASSYLRGVNYIQVPTTLLAMLDSSVGGKTAINTPEGKNLIGSFYQPSLVHIDTDCLDTLPDKEFKSGLGELAKYALLGSRWDGILGESFISFITRNTEKILAKDREIMSDIVSHCLKIKANIVEEDEKEKGIRAYLNLGHTFGHAIEEVTQYTRYSHGEAVAIGTICAFCLALKLKLIKKKDLDRARALMDVLGLDYELPDDIPIDRLMQAFKYDKKVQDGKVRFILPSGNLGSVDIVKDVDMNLVRESLLECSCL